MSKSCKDIDKPVNFIEIGAGHAGQRIDNFLLSHLKTVPKSRVYRIVRKGEVRVNKGRIKPDYRLQLGDRVRIPPLRIEEAAPKPPPSSHILTLVDASVLHEDDNLLVLNKPAGIAVHSGSGVSHGVIEALRMLRPAAPFLELVHRLDRDTSGCLMIAKTRPTLLALHELLRTGTMEKYYLALVQGRWSGGARTVNAALRRNVLRSGERMVQITEEGKEAESVFEPQRIYADTSLMRIALHSGRTHQIRVHAAHIGHPLAGDVKYGDARFNRAMRAIGLKRVFLHAREIALKLPGGSRKIHVTAPLPADLQQVLEKLA
ncbi:MAG: 23S rRNA pseudouridine(955/2504/2580) synthase RluC [Proteobacteria bacterium]|nr:23S rRNA pseudouridine(955/2504/2580) synthase RluC [Pseudomonadota bacterium]